MSLLKSLFPLLRMKEKQISTFMLQTQEEKSDCLLSHDIILKYLLEMSVSDSAVWVLVFPATCAFVYIFFIMW